jgi:pyruvate,orthophosphate dikinase
MQDIEFTVEQRQALHAADPQRQAHRARASSSPSTSSRRVITKEEAVLRLEPAQLDSSSTRTIDPKDSVREVSPRACPPRPAPPVGQVVFEPAEAAADCGEGTAVILVRSRHRLKTSRAWHAARASSPPAAA